MCTFPLLSFSCFDLVTSSLCLSSQVLTFSPLHLFTCSHFQRFTLPCSPFHLFIPSPCHLFNASSNFNQKRCFYYSYMQPFYMLPVCHSPFTHSVTLVTFTFLFHLLHLTFCMLQFTSYLPFTFYSFAPNNRANVPCHFDVIT